MVSIRATGAYVVGTANLNPVIPLGAVAGDMMLCFYGAKPYNDVPVMDNGWTDLGFVTDGVIPPASNVGSMQVRAFYKIHTGTEFNPNIITLTNNVSGAVIIVFQKSPGKNWEVPVGTGGGDAIAGTGFNVVGAIAPGLTAGDMIAAYAAIRSDAGTQSVISLAAAGLVFSPFIESPAADLTTNLGADMAMSGGYASVVSGLSVAQPMYDSLLATAHTGSAFMVRLREIDPPVVPPPALMVGDMYILLTFNDLMFSFQVKSPQGTDIGLPYVYLRTQYRIMHPQRNDLYITIYKTKDVDGDFPFVAQFPRDRIIAIKV